MPLGRVRGQMLKPPVVLGQVTPEAAPEVGEGGQRWPPPFASSPSEMWRLLPTPWIWAELRDWLTQQNVIERTPWNF